MTQALVCVCFALEKGTTIDKSRFPLPPPPTPPDPFFCLSRLPLPAPRPSNLLLSYSNTPTLLVLMHRLVALLMPLELFCHSINLGRGLCPNPRKWDSPRLSLA